MPTDKVNALHKAASNDFDLGTPEEFEGKLQDEGKRQTFFDAASSKYNLGSFEEFSGKVISAPVTSAASVVETQDVPAPTEQIEPEVLPASEGGPAFSFKRIVQDDAPLTNIIEGLARGANRLGQGIGTNLQVAGMERVGQKIFDTFKKREALFEPSEKLGGSIVDNPSLALNPEWLATSIAEMTPALAGAIGVGTITAGVIGGGAIALGVSNVGKLEKLSRIGGALAGGIFGGTQEGASTYQDVIESGGTQEEAELAHGFMSAASAGLNALSIGRLLKKLPAGAVSRGFARTMNGATEALTEWMEEPAESVAKDIAGGVPIDVENAIGTLRQGANVLPPSMILGFLGGGISGTNQAQPSPVDTPIERDTAEEIPTQPTAVAPDPVSGLQTDQTGLTDEEIEIQAADRPRVGTVDTPIPSDVTATFAGNQIDPENDIDIPLYNIDKDIPGHPAGSTVTEKELIENNIPVLDAPEKPAIKIADVKDGGTVGEIDNRGKADRLNNRLFGLAKAKGVRSSIIFEAAEQQGITELKFEGEGAVTEVQLGDIMNNLRRVNKSWPDNVKKHFIMNGDVPLPDYHSSGPMNLGRGGKIINSLREINIKFLQSMETTLQKMGPIGIEIAERAKNADQYGQSAFAQTNAVLNRAFKHMSGKEISRLIIARQSGTMGQESKKIQNANGLIGRELQKISDIAQTLEFKTRKSDGTIKPFVGLGEQYWPQVHEFDWIRSERKQARLVKQWMDKNDLTQVEAERQLDTLFDQSVKRLNHNLDYEREFDVGGWIGDPASPGYSKVTAVAGLKKYFMGAYHRIGEAMNFDKEGKQIAGEEHKTVNELIDSEESRDKRVLYAEAIKKIRGLEPSAREVPFLSALRNLNIIKYLGFAQIPNAFQLSITVVPKVMTLGVTRGTKVLMQGIKEATVNSKFAREEVGAAVLQNMREVTGLTSGGITGKVATKFLDFTGFSGMESGNNIGAASTAKPYMMELLKISSGHSPSRAISVTFRRRTERMLDIAQKELKRYGFTDEAIATGEATDIQMQRAAWRFARDTQFRGSAIDLPMFWSSSYGKLLTQFKTFSFNINKLAWHHFAKPAIEYVRSGGKRGTMTPILTFAGTSMMSGEIIAFVRSVLLKGRERPDWDEEKFKRLLENVISAGTMGLWFDAYQAAVFGRPLEFVAGPSAGGAAEGIEAAVDIGKGNLERGAGKLAKQNIPFVRGLGQKEERRN